MKNSKKLHFNISERKVLLKVTDVVSILVSLYVCHLFFGFSYFQFTSQSAYRLFVFAIYIHFFSSIFEMYNLQVASNQYDTIKNGLLTVATTVLTYLFTPIFSPPIPQSRLQIIAFFLIVLFTFFLWRLFYIYFLASNKFSKKIIIVAESVNIQSIINELGQSKIHHEIVGFVDTTSHFISDFQGKKIEISELKNFVSKNSVAEIVVASQGENSITVELYNELLTLLEKGMTIREYTQLYEELMLRIPVEFVSKDFYRYFPFNRNNNNKLYLFTVRFWELLIAILGIIIGIGLLPLILIGNLLGNQGNLFYSQNRVGKNGEVFKILKLRTMIKNAEKDGVVFAQQNDARITRFGKILRKTRIDEIPQFYNILKGEMAIIGPRPERPEIVKKIDEMMPFYETRHIIKPGLTGWAQVNYSYGENISDSLIKLQYDLYYIKHRSLILDINILIKTLSTVLFYRGR